MKPRLLLLLFLPAMMGTWALAGLVREATGPAPEPWRMAFHGIASLIFAGLAVALMRSAPPPRRERRRVTRGA